MLGPCSAGKGCLPGSCLHQVPSRRGMAFAFLPSPNTVPPCTDWPCSTGWMGSFARIPERLPKVQRALHSPASWRWARPWGSILGPNPVVLVNVCSLSTGSPISDCQAGPACGQAITVVPRAWGLVGSRDRVAVLQAPAAGAEGVRGQGGCRAYESPLLGPGRGGGMGKGSQGLSCCSHPP